MSEFPESIDQATEMAIAAYRLYAVDPAAAAELFMRAAAAGNENAKIAAARMFIDGDGVDFDPRRALQLLSEVCSADYGENRHLVPLLCKLLHKISLRRHEAASPPGQSPVGKVDLRANILFDQRRNRRQRRSKTALKFAKSPVATKQG